MNVTEAVSHGGTSLKNVLIELWVAVKSKEEEFDGLADSDQLLRTLGILWEDSVCVDSMQMNATGFHEVNQL